MRIACKTLLTLAIVAALAQCGKKGTNTTGGALPFGTKVELQPEHLPNPPAGTLYEAWELQLIPSGANYALRYFKFARFGWDSYKYRFKHPQTGTDMGYVFKASPDEATNLFTDDLSAWAREDSIGLLLQTLLRGQSVPLPGVRQNLTGMRAILLSIEPAGETGPDTATPAAPFLVGFSNDSGKFKMIYPYNYRDPDFAATSYFLATPTDSVNDMGKNIVQDGDLNSAKTLNESRGIWLGSIDTSRGGYAKGICPAPPLCQGSQGSPDPILRKLTDELLPGWQFEGWFRNRDSTTLVSLGTFVRADSADLANPYAFNPDSLFPLPGEDFLVNPPPGLDSLLGGRVQITLEPRPDPDPAQFPLVIFQGTVPTLRHFISNESGLRERNVQVDRFMENRTRFLPKIAVRIIPEERK